MRSENIVERGGAASSMAHRHPSHDPECDGEAIGSGARQHGLGNNPGGEIESINRQPPASRSVVRRADPFHGSDPLVCSARRDLPNLCWRTPLPSVSERVRDLARFVRRVTASRFSIRHWHRAVAVADRSVSGSWQNSLVAYPSARCHLASHRTRISSTTPSLSFQPWGGCFMRAVPSITPWTPRSDTRTSMDRSPSSRTGGHLVCWVRAFACPRASGLPRALPALCWSTCWRAGMFAECRHSC